MYRRPEMRMELVPQMTPIALPDFWGERMAKLSDWYVDAGKPELARQTHAQLLR